MIPFLLLAFAVFLAKNSGLNVVKSEELADPQVPNSLSGYQARYRDWYTEQSMAARQQVDLRLPFGPNPQQKYIQEMQFFNNPYYQMEYKKQLHTERIKNQDWRLDYTTNGVLNNWPNQPHQPEDNIKKIESFAVTQLPNNNSEYFQKF